MALLEFVQRNSSKGQVAVTGRRAMRGAGGLAKESAIVWARQTLILAGETFREARRARLSWAAAGLMGGVLLIFQQLGGLHFGGDERRFLWDLSAGWLVLGGTWLVLTLGSVLGHRPLERGEVALLVAGPVCRESWLPGRFLGLWFFALLVILPLYVVLGALLTLHGVWQNVGDALRWEWLGLGMAFEGLRLGVLLAMSLLVAQVAGSSGVALLVSGALWFICQLQGAALLAWEGADDLLIQLGAWILSRVLPDLPLLQAPVPFSDQQAPNTAEISGTLFYGLFYILFLLAAGIALMRRKDL